MPIQDLSKRYTTIGWGETEIFHATIVEELRNEEILESRDPSKDIVKDIAENEKLEKEIDEIDINAIEEEVEAIESDGVEINKIQQSNSNKKLGDAIFDALEDYYNIKNNSIAYDKLVFG